MKEYRALEQKRVSQGLGPEEARRHAELSELVSADAAAAPRGGFDVNAAAAKLRDSLLPAGLRNRPPPTPEMVEPEAVEPVQPEPDPAAAALASAYAEQPFTPLESQPAAEMDFFDPAALGSEPEPGATAWDPGAQAPYEAAPGEGAWDPNAQAPYDPAAVAGEAAWDPNAQPDQGAEAGAAYDAAGGYAPPADGSWDPGAAAAEPGAHDESAYAAPAEGGWDPAAQGGGDATAPVLGWDSTPDGGFDPSTLDHEAPGEQPAEPDASGPFAAAEPTAGEAGPEGWAVAEPAADASAQPLDLAGWEPGPAEAPAGEETEPAFAAAHDSVDTQGEWSTAGAGAAPLDSWEAPAAPAQGEDPYAMLPPEVEPYAAEGEPAGDLAPGAPEDLSVPGGWDPTPEPAAGPDGGLPFDAAAASAIDPANLPEGFGPASGDYDDTQGFAVNGYEAPPTPHLADDGSQDASASWHPDTALDRGFELASGGSFDAKADAGTPQWAGGGEAAAPWEGGELAEAEPEPELGPPPELDRSAPDFSTEGGDDFLAVPAPPLALGGPAPVTRPARPAEPAPAVVAAAPPAPAPRAATTSSSIPVAPAAARPAPAPSAPTRAVPAPAPGPADEIPTVEAEEVLEPEEILDHHDDATGPVPDLAFEDVAFTPPPTASPVARTAPAPAATAAGPEQAGEPGLVVHGVHRVVVHPVEGQAKRGVLQDADLAAPVLGLSSQPGAEPDVLGTDRVKAIFFMLAPGETAPKPEGKRVRVTFRDGRQVAGFSPDYREDGVGFFIIPAELRTNTGRIWIYRAAVKSVAVS